MVVRFVVLGQPVGKNQSRGLRGGRFFIPRITKLWQRSVAIAAHEAAGAANWPDPFAIKSCSYRIHRFNVRGDADRGDTFLVDALEFRRWWTPRGEVSLSGPIGLFGNDKAAYCDGSYPSKSDSGGPRLEVEVTLRAIHAPHIADEFRRRWYKNEARRTLRKKAKLDSKEFNKAKTPAAVSRSRDELAQVEKNLGIRLPL